MVWQSGIWILRKKSPRMFWHKRHLEFAKNNSKNVLVQQVKKLLVAAHIRPVVRAALSAKVDRRWHVRPQGRRCTMQRTRGAEGSIRARAEGKYWITPYVGTAISLLGKDDMSGHWAYEVTSPFANNGEKQRDMPETKSDAVSQIWKDVRVIVETNPPPSVFMGYVTNTTSQHK